MDAIQYLRQEHSKFRNNLAAINNITSGKIKLNKFKIFSKDLSNHEKMEQKVWYPVLRKNVDLRDIIKHLLGEEKSAAKTMKKLLTSSVGIIWKMRFRKIQTRC